MKLSIDTVIKKQISSLLKDEDILKNLLIATDISTTFTIKGYQDKVLNIPFANISTFTLDVFESLGLNPVNATFVHIYCFNDTIGESPDPIQFTTFISDGTNNVNLGKMSQLQLANISTLTSTHEITISNPVVAATKQCVLIVIVGSK